MGAAVGQRLDVMDFLGRGEDAAFVALLTEGVGGGVSVTDTLPRSAVAPLGGGVPLIAFVAAVLLLGVGLAEPSIGQVGASRETAGAARLFRHGDHLHLDKRKALRVVVTCKASCNFYYHHCNDTIWPVWITIEFTVRIPALPHLQVLSCGA